MSRKKDKVYYATFPLNPKVDLNNPESQMINGVADVILRTTPSLYDRDLDILPTRDEQSATESKRTQLSMSVIDGSDKQYRRQGGLLFSDPRLTNVPSKAAYSATARDIAGLMYLPGIDRQAVSRLGALMLLRSKLSDSSIIAERRPDLVVPRTFRALNKNINDEVDRIIDQMGVQHKPEVIRTIRGIKNSMDIRATQIRNNIKSYEKAKENQQKEQANQRRLQSIRDLAQEGLPA